MIRRTSCLVQKSFFLMSVTCLLYDKPAFLSPATGK